VIAVAIAAIVTLGVLLGAGMAAEHQRRREFERDVIAELRAIRFGRES
jgi:hypothetical protein